VPKDTFFGAYFLLLDHNCWLTSCPANAKDIAIFSAVEPGVGIIAGCIVTLRPLLRRYVAAFRWRSDYSPGRAGRRPYLQETLSSVHLRAPQTPDLDQIPDPPGPVFLAHVSPKGKIPLVEFDVEKGLKEPVHRGRRLQMPKLRFGGFGGLPLGLFKSSPHSSKSNENWQQEEAAHIATARLSRGQYQRDKIAIEKKPDRWKPLPPTPKSRSSGLPLNLFGTSPPSQIERKELTRDERTGEGRTKKKPARQPKNKRGSGLPIDMFVSHTDTITSSSDGNISHVASSL
jgi:hypothetical protein